MRTALTTFQPDLELIAWPLVTAGEAFAADHPVVVAHDECFGPDDTPPQRRSKGGE